MVRVNEPDKKCAFDVVLGMKSEVEHVLYHSLWVIVNLHSSFKGLLHYRYMFISYIGGH